MKDKQTYLTKGSFALLLFVILGYIVKFYPDMLIGFDQFFTLFHQVLFVGDATWLFDPYKDPIILALPEDYFLHAFLIFFVLYEGAFGWCYGWSRKRKTVD